MATLKRKQRALITAMLIIVHMAAEGGRAPRESTIYSIFPDGGSVFPVASPLSCSRPSSSHDGMLPDGIARLGKWGMIVPAVTTSPSSNFARAKSLACVSVSNVCVDRERRLRTAVPLHGSSKVTYQVWFFIRWFRRISHSAFSSITFSGSAARLARRRRQDAGRLRFRSPCDN